MIGNYSTRPGSQKTVPGLKWVAPALHHKLEEREHRADFAAIVANPNAQGLVKVFSNAARTRGLALFEIEYKGLIRLIQDLRRSDHAPFWSVGYPALMVSDTANFRSNTYHTAMDVPEMIDFRFAATVVMTVLDGVLEIVAEQSASDTSA